MKLGLQINDYTWAGGPPRLGPTLTEIAQVADSYDFSMIGVADHMWQASYMGGPEYPELESYTTLGFLAAHTTRARLLAFVSGVHFRHPAVLIKAVTTLDVLSGGRAWLGIGAGWYEEETRGLGIPYPPLRERFDLVEETIQIGLRMWDGEHGDERPLTTAHYHLERPLNSPQSLTRPHPPILIAGDGEQRTLRLVARYADACSLRPSPDIPKKLDILRRHCETEGRDYDAIEITCAFSFDIGESGEKTAALIDQLRWLAGMGIQTVTGFVPHIDRLAPLEIIGREVIPAVADL
jgi:F420-dependent oxidoreductase-like protein